MDVSIINPFLAAFTEILPQIGFQQIAKKRFLWWEQQFLMMGMEVSEFDKVAQSAISEIGNMFCANVCTQFSEIEIAGLDISSPTLDGARRGYITCSQSYCYRL